MLGSTVLGGIMQLMGQSAKDRHDLMMAQFQNREASWAAARKMQNPSAAWVRRFIVTCLMAMAAFILTAPMWGFGTQVPIEVTTGGSYLFGLIDTTETTTVWQALEGMVTPDWLPFAIMNVIGFYFGAASMKR